MIGPKNLKSCLYRFYIDTDRIRLHLITNACFGQYLANAKTTPGTLYWT